MSKRPQSPTLIPNPFIKKRNLTWTLAREPSSPEGQKPKARQSNRQPSPQPDSAAIESGQVHITDHLSHFAALLSSRVLLRSSPAPAPPQIPIRNYADLYASNVGSPDGTHFVIHQHDHPVAGTHYDLRLQINETSSASWAIMYGLPGDPNSRRGNRNATETRIHCLWNHLVETASSSTGSLLIWDTGTYTILPRRSKHAPSRDPSSQTSSTPPPSPTSLSSPSGPTQQQLLRAAFQSRKIRLQLHGSKLPDPYVLNLRLTKPEDAAGRLRSSRPPGYRRRVGRRRKPQEPAPETSSSSDSDGAHHHEGDSEGERLLQQVKSGGQSPDGVQDPHITSPTEREILELEDHRVRLTNAYPGAENTIGSIHQRRWYLSLDKEACGFVRRGGTRWELPAREGATPGSEGGPERGAGRLTWPFYVRGVQVETSAVTGRRGDDVLRDEGVHGFVGRKGWKPVLE